MPIATSFRTLLSALLVLGLSEGWAIEPRPNPKSSLLSAEIRRKVEQRRTLHHAEQIARGEKTERSLRLGTEILRLHTWKYLNSGVTIETNPSCVKKTCGATKSLEALHVRPAPLQAKDLLGGKNPGAVACSKVLKGKVALGITETGAQDSLCLFKDRSWITCASVGRLLVLRSP